MKMNLIEVNRFFKNDEGAGFESISENAQKYAEFGSDAVTKAEAEGYTTFEQRQYYGTTTDTAAEKIPLGKDEMFVGNEVEGEGNEDGRVYKVLVGIKGKGEQIEAGMI